MTTTRTVYVTDHALLRYLERVIGIDIDGHRADLAELAEEGVARGCCFFDNGGVVLSLEGPYVKTVMLLSEHGKGGNGHNGAGREQKDARP